MSGDPMRLDVFLKTVEPFDALERETLRALAACARRAFYGPGDRIITAGEPGDALYVIIRGRVQVRVDDEDGPKRIALLYGGEMLGEMALLTGEPRTAHVIADIATECAVIARENFFEVVAREPSVAGFLTELLGTRLLDGGQISQVGNFQVFEEIGRGGMGIVFAGYHPRLRRSVAIKMLNHTHVYDEGFAARFAEESSVVARLEHPNIVQVFDHVAAYGTQFIVMEFVDGPTLADRMRVEGPMGEAAVRRLILQLSRALGHAHARGVTHRDVKPENIMLPPGRPLKLMDFGIAGAAVDPDGDDDPIGTPVYMAPEHIEGEALDARVDIYPLGVMAFEMLTGERPFGTLDTEMLIDHKPTAALPDVRRWRPEISDVMATFIERAAAPDPEDRFPDCAAVRAHFGRGPTLLKPGLRGQTLVVLYDPDESHAVGDAVDHFVASLAGRSVVVSVAKHELT